MMESQPEEPITIQVDNPRVFHAAIEYLYTQQIILNEENAVDVLMCANQYSFADLLHLVEDFLCVHLQSSSLEETGTAFLPSFHNAPDESLTRSASLKHTTTHTAQSTCTM